MVGTSKGPMLGKGAQRPKQDKGGSGSGNPLLDLFDLMFPGSAAMGGGETTAPKGGEPRQTIGVARNQGKKPATLGSGQPDAMRKQPTQTVQAQEVAPRDFWGTGEGINMDAMSTVPEQNPVFASDRNAFGPGFNAQPASPPVTPDMMNPLPVPPTPMRPPASMAPPPGATPPMPMQNPALSGGLDPVFQQLLGAIGAQSNMPMPEMNPAFHAQPGEPSPGDLSKFFASMMGG